MLKPLEKGDIILAFGDSLTNGYGAADGQNYPDVLEEISGHKVINAGVNGEVSSEGLKRLPVIFEKYQPELVIICHGGNDFLRKMDTSKTKENIDEMVDYVLKNNAQCLLLGVPEMGISPSVPAFYPEIAEKYGISFDKNTVFRLQIDSSKKSDRIHFNESGYRIMAEKIYKFFQRNK